VFANEFGGPLNSAALCGRIARIMPKAGSVPRPHTGLSSCDVGGVVVVVVVTVGGAGD